MNVTFRKTARTLNGARIYSVTVNGVVIGELYREYLRGGYETTGRHYYWFLDPVEQLTDAVESVGGSLSMVISPNYQNGWGTLSGAKSQLVSAFAEPWTVDRRDAQVIGELVGWLLHHYDYDGDQ